MSDSANAPYNPSYAFTNVTVQNSTTITARTPAHAQGTTYIVVTNPDTRAARSSAFTYNAAPTVSSLSVTSGSTAGGASVTITGANFISGGTVFLGGILATSQYNSSSSITFTTPANSTPGWAELLVFNPDGQYATKANAFNYIYTAPPTITGLNKTSGGTAGGLTVTVTGTGFIASPAPTVTFGGTTVQYHQSSGSTSFWFTTPAHAAGAVDLTVTNWDGQTTTAYGAFTYNDSPSIDTVSPSAGLTTGGTQVTVTGTNFQTGAIVYCVYNGSDYQTFQSITVVDSNTITAVSKANVALTCGIKVKNPDNQYATKSSAFTYEPPLSISGVSPNLGTADGGTQITITGIKFKAGATVTMGGESATVTNISGNGTTITATTPAYPSGGKVGITVANTDGETKTFNNAYTYTLPPTVVSLSSTSGTTLGGRVINITGTNFIYSPPPTVVFGGVTVTARPALYSTTLFAITTPVHSAGPVDLVITNADGQVITVTDAYTYYPPPTISSINPASGTDVGGTPITITGSNFREGAIINLSNWRYSSNNYNSYFNTFVPTSVTVVDSNTITAVTPVGTGVNDVIVVNNDGQYAILPTAFAYYHLYPPPTISSVSPVGVNTNGGTAARINGTGFMNPAITVDGVTVTRLSYDSGGINVTMPSHAPGTADITVTNSDAQAVTATAAFTYDYPPDITSITPSYGLTSGGQSITIGGTGFKTSGATLVKIDGTACTNVVVLNGTTIAATTPAKSVRVANVTVTNPDGQVDTLVQGYTYEVPLNITSVTPNFGKALGGTGVTITGVKFKPGATVTMGGESATVTNISGDGTTITATTPAYPAGGKVAITVENTDGETKTLSNAYTYTFPPTFTSLNKIVGPTTGGQYVWVTGTNFRSPAVKFGGVTVAIGSLTLLDPVEMVYTFSFWTPPHAAGLVDIEITSADGQSVSATDVYTYNNGVNVDSVSPDMVPTGGGTAITISGSNFQEGATVFLGNHPYAEKSYFNDSYPTAVTVVDSNTITAVTAASTALIYDVVVTNPDFQYGTLVNGLTYTTGPIIYALSPAGGTANGGTDVTISGRNLDSDAEVTFDGVPATYVSNIGTTSLTVTSPSHAAGLINVTVTNPDDRYATRQYRYYAPPAITSVNKPYTLTTGGQEMDIIGTNFRTGDTVKIQGHTATVHSISANTISVQVPTGLDVGAATVEVTSPAPDNTETATLEDTLYVYPTGPIRALENPGNNAFTFTLDSNTTQDITFNKPLTPVSRIAAEEAITASNSNLNLTYTWNSRSTTITVHNGSSSSIFNNNVYAVLLDDVFGTVTENVQLIKSIPKVHQVEVASEVTLSPSITEMVINQNLNSDITIPQTLTQPTMNVKPLYIDNRVVMPAVNINAETSEGLVQVSFAEGTSITPADTEWDGVMEISKVLDPEVAASLVTVTPGRAIANVSGFSMGRDNSGLYFNHAVRLKFTGMAGKLAGFFDGESFTKITGTCPDDTQSTNDLMIAGGACKLVVGDDMVIWTRHFTDFVFYDEELPPTVTGINPVSGTTEGGTAVTITGTNFGADIGNPATVTIGGFPASSVVVVDGTTITAVTPVHAAGLVNVVVTNPNLLFGTLTNGYEYIEPSVLNVTNVVPGSGVLAGGTTVTISGTQFVDVTDVTFGADSCININVLNDTTITCDTPPNLVGGVVNVTVTTITGSDTLAGGFNFTDGGGACAPGVPGEQCGELDLGCSGDAPTFTVTPSATFDFSTDGAGGPITALNIAQNIFKDPGGAALQTGAGTDYIEVGDLRDPSSPNCNNGLSLQVSASGTFAGALTSTPIPLDKTYMLSSSDSCPANHTEKGGDVCFDDTARCGRGNNVSTEICTAADGVTTANYDGTAFALIDTFTGVNKPLGTDAVSATPIELLSFDDGAELYGNAGLATTYAAQVPAGQPADIYTLNLLYTIIVNP